MVYLAALNDYPNHTPPPTFTPRFGASRSVPSNVCHVEHLTFLWFRHVLNIFLDNFR